MHPHTLAHPIQRVVRAAIRLGPPALLAVLAVVLALPGQADPLRRLLRHAPFVPFGVAYERSLPQVECSGWSRLAAGEAELALEAFAFQARVEPRAGGPKVGYAVAASLLGEHERGLWAMRRAFRLDAEGAAGVSLPGSLRDSLRELMQSLRDPAQGPYDAKESAFMLAALSTLVGDREAARSLVDLLLHQGSEDPAVQGLDRVLRVRIARR